MTLLEGFMSESYDFRHNVLADKYEVREKGTAAWRPLTDKGINSIARRKRSAPSSAQETAPDILRQGNPDPGKTSATIAGG